MIKTDKIAVIGSGMMGMSFAALFTGNGYETKVLATCPSSADRGQRHYCEIFDVLSQRNLATAPQIQAATARLSFAFDYSELSDCTFFVECTVEDLSVKHAVYKKIERFCPKCKAIASSSSALSPDDLCSEIVRYGDKILVAHPFNPPHVVPFVEMVKGHKTNQSSVDTAYQILEDCGRKVCIMNIPAPGFIANRLQHALLREALYMVEKGYATPEDIDKALMYSFMPRYTSVGLFEHQDAAGLDMVKSIDDYLFPYLSDQKATGAYVNACVASGNLGQKTGSGIYEWDSAYVADFKARTVEPYWKYFNWSLPE